MDWSVTCLIQRRYLAHCLYVAVIAGCGAGSDGPGGTSQAASPASKAGVVSARELAEFLDLSKLPFPPGTQFNGRNAAELQALVPLAIQPTADFYLKALAEKGFKPTDEPGAHIITAEYAQASLKKDGHAVSLSVIPGSDGKVMVSVYRHGNLDAGSLPQSEGAKPTYGSSTLHMYVAKGSVAEEVDFVRKAFTEHGWQEFTPPNTAMVDDPEHRQFTFRNKGYLVSGSVGVAPAQQNKTMVQYQVRTLAHELPAPADAVKVEYDDERWMLNCEVPGGLGVAESYYLKTMPELGYKPLKHDEPRDKSRLLRFGTPEKGILLLTIRTEDHKASQVEFLHYSAELLAKMREQDQKPNEPPAAPTTPGAVPEVKSIFARAIPLPKSAKDVEYQVDQEQIRFQSGDNIKMLVADLRMQLTAEGWKEFSEATVAEENAGTILFRQGDAMLTIVLLNLGLGGNTSVTISTAGLEWRDAEQE